MKKISTLVTLLLVVLTGSAQPVSRQEAMDRAIQFLQSTPAQGSTRRAMTATPQLNEVTTDMDHLYMFNVDGGGYVITSGDDRAVAVLGYSTTGTLDWQHMPENMRYWLQSYNEAIAKIAQSDLPAAAPRQRAARAAIKPMVTCHWSQEPVYNEECPMYTGTAAAAKGKQCVTGCTATAIAQVMYYHKWPKTATTAVAGYDYEVDNVQKGLVEKFTLPELPATTFDWDNMRDQYLKANSEEGGYDVLPDVTPAQRKAVATLMRYVGQMTHMSYSPATSLAYHDHAVDLMPKYFNYDKGIRGIYRYDYTIDEWENIIYNELAANRPVVYAGMTNGGGHNFVCDGYDGEGLFHINWGWAGDSDNYFSLSVLNANSYSKNVEAGSDFNQTQTALIGIQKEAGGSAGAELPELKMPVSPVVSLVKGQWEIALNLIYFSEAYPTATFEIAVFEKLEGGQWKLFTDGDPINLQTGLNSTYAFTFNQTTNEADCQKNLYVRFRYKGNDNKYGDWQQLAKNLCVEYKVSNGKLTLTALPALNKTNFDVKSYQVTRGTGELKEACELTVSIENKGAEFNGAFTLTPYFINQDDAGKAYEAIDSDDYDDSYPKYASLTTGAFLKANSTTPVKFSFTPDKEGSYLFLLFSAAQPDNDLYYFALDFPAEVTAIENLTPSQRHTLEESTPSHSAVTWYDLQGRKLSGRPAQKGIYIHHRQKRVIK